MLQARKVLALAPHPDDVELAVGGTLSKLLEQGTNVQVAAFSRCVQSLPQSAGENALVEEFHASMDAIGVPKENRFVFDYPVRRFLENRQDILEELVSLRARVSPDLVLLPHSADGHQDHEVIHAEGVRAFLKSASILGYDVPWNSRTFNAQHFVALEERHLDKKLAALQSYRTQVEKGRAYFASEFVRGLAITRGVQAGVEYAEAFEVIRSFG